MTIRRRTFLMVALAIAAMWSVGFLILAKASLGPDVSSYQGCSINWNSVHAAGYRFAFLKATEGLTYHDACFGQNWHAVRSAGLYRGAYHFGHADSFRDPKAEAYTFNAEVLAHTGYFDRTSVPVLDIEAGNLRGRALEFWIDNWTAVVQSTWHRSGLIYSGRWFLGDRGVNLSSAYRAGWRLWSSQYDCRQASPYSGFPRVDFKQFTDGQYGCYPHYVNGIGHSDISAFLGSDDQMAQFFNLVSPTAIKRCYWLNVYLGRQHGKPPTWNHYAHHEIRHHRKWLRDHHYVCHSGKVSPA